MPQKGKPTRKFTALGVHIFAGGFTCGVKQAGFEVLGHLEISNYGVGTVKANWPDLDVQIDAGGNWTHVTSPLEGEVDFIYANPPCAIFSTAGISTTRGKEGWKTDPRLACWTQAIDVCKEVMPQAFCLESVCQAYTKGREVVDKFTNELLAAGYSVYHILEDAMWCGLPQSRKRFFLVGYRPSLDLTFNFNYSKTPPTVGQIFDALKGGAGYTNRHDTGANFARWIKHTPPGGKLRDAYDKAHKKGKYDPGPVSPFTGANVKKEDLEDTPEGGYVRRTFDRKYPGKIKGRPGFMFCRLHRNKQMGAFTGDLFCHPTEHRFIGVNEMKALCGYPQTYKMEGNERGFASQLARAVLPPVGRWMAESVKRALEAPRKKGARRSVVLRDLRKPPSTTVDLSSEYL